MSQQLELVLETWNKDLGPVEPSHTAVVCRSLADLQDYNSPSAPAALLKCCVLCCGIVSLGTGTLQQQLRSAGGRRPVPDILSGLYRASLEAPEAFQAEFEATTSRVLSILESFPLKRDELETAQGENALHFAAGCGSLEVCQALLERHPDLIHQEDTHGHTPLFWAVRHGLAGATQLLIRKGAASWHCDKRGLTALHWAAALGFARLCGMLVDVPAAAALKNQRCSRGWTPLHSSAYGGSAECCTTLLDAKADVGQRTPQEWTALHLAAVKGHIEVLEVLLPHCSTEMILALDRHGCSAKDLAEEAGEHQAEAMLQQETHRQLMRSWNPCSQKQPEVKLSDLLAAALCIQAPVLEKVGRDAVELSCHIVDLQFRVSGYVVEVKHCGGPDGAAPARVYYARTVEQRKVEFVEFLVPRMRSSGQAVWQRGERYKFRIRGCCERRLAPEPGAPRQVISDWSIAACGLRLATWSSLPQGSGLGSSSVLAAAAVKALMAAFGLDMDAESLIHAVQNVEQMLTTGGGWQDQVGAILGGAKLTRSKASLPLRVLPEQLPLQPSFSEEFESRLLLIFTGRPRLAKHLLQNVIRRWFSRVPEICETVKGLVDNAQDCAEAIRAGDVEEVGRCLSRYWAQKQVMAAGCEPRPVGQLRKILEADLLGFSLAGAGGGGFGTLLMRKPSAKERVQQALGQCPGLEDAYVCEATIDHVGMELALDSVFETTSLLPDAALADVVGALGRNLRPSRFVRSLL
ncbi:FCSK [Symbiodinium sp. CCMP2592]|nr:FCSK [Symbiodinium sp. CCMP2592]